jgi:hypothetical protein
MEFREKIKWEVPECVPSICYAIAVKGYHFLLMGNFRVNWNIFLLQFVVHTNETTRMDESLIGDKIIAPLKESVSEVEKLVRAGVYEERHFIHTYHDQWFIENVLVVIV